MRVLSLKAASAYAESKENNVPLVSQPPPAVPLVMQMQQGQGRGGGGSAKVPVPPVGRNSAPVAMKTFELPF
jgi:hypothetical protein